MPSYFFKTTTDAHDLITRLFDFVWPTAAAMWNLRWQVTGYLSVVPNATDNQLKARFSEGSDLTPGNLKRACVDHSWDDQKEDFARIILINLISIYESWTAELLDDLNSNNRIMRNALQYPDSSAKDGKGVTWAVSELTKVESSALRTSLYPKFAASNRYSFSKLEALLRCFRYFKEVRNSDMHGGRIVEQRLFDAAASFSTVATPSDLDVSEVPIHFPAIIGEKARLSLRGVTGFAEIILKMLTTLDAEFSRSAAAEAVFIRRWHEAHPKRINFRLKSAKRENQVKRLVERAGFPRPSSPDGLGAWLKAKRLVDY